MKKVVGISYGSEPIIYPNKPPYNPPRIYPEFAFNGLDFGIDEGNKVYELVRLSLYLAGLDMENYETKYWNPFKELIREGETVFIKPNMIAEKHQFREDWEYVITHGSVIRPIVDYLYISMNGKGRIIIGDGPQTDQNFWKIAKQIGLFEIQEIYNKMNKDFEVEIVNLQDEYWVTEKDVISDVIKLSGDPRGKIFFNLSNNSCFSELDGTGKKYYGAYYDINETNEAHSNGKHIYAIARSPIIADLFINVPKLKTHKKCGITVNLKSLVGINANKNLLPHYIIGSPENGGDQFPKANTKRNLENKIVLEAKELLATRNKFVKFLARKFKGLAYLVFGKTNEVIRSGNWYGNDTVWRMALDLNKILFYGNPDGTIRYSNPKRFFSVVDGIIGMEGNGPYAGDPVRCNIIVAGSDPVAVDAVCAKLMGFDYKKIKLIYKAFEQTMLPITFLRYEDILCVSNNPFWNKKLIEIQYNEVFHFKAPSGWVGQIELEP
jgi:uncharacterized protein (DUF362 family)